MRVVILLLATIYVSFAQVEDFFIKRAGQTADEIAARRQQFLESFTRSDVHNVQEKLGKLRKRWDRRLNENHPNIKKEIALRMKASHEYFQGYRMKQRQQLREHGDTLAEINEKANVTDFMYQGDIVLTSEQADQLIAESSAIADGDRFKKKHFLN